MNRIVFYAALEIQSVINDIGKYQWTCLLQLIGIFKGFKGRR